MAVLPRSLAELVMARLPAMSHKPISIYLIYSAAKGSVHGQFETYTWQFCQDFWQSLLWLDCPPGVIFNKHISYLFSCQRFRTWPVWSVHMAVLPSPRAKLILASLPAMSHKPINIYLIYSAAKGSEHDHFETYTWQFCQGLWQSLLWLDCPPGVISNKHISNLFSCQRFRTWPVWSVHMAVLPSPRAKLILARLLAMSHKPINIYLIYSAAKGSKHDQFETYTWLFCQGLWQSLLCLSAHQDLLVNK